ncbi:MAG: class I SAM-dependent methyltransferase [Solirubrobacteraceae bacterium]|nr:class I SAM-dependent methyltransferase [Solirubrobacteraceae bacterium]
MTADRLDREREFHDRAFSEQTRAEVGRFYSVTGALRAWYENALVERAPGAQALEYGCGPGSAAYLLAEHGAVVTGIDLSPVAIDLARREGERRWLETRLDFRVMDAERLELDDDAFDLVCGSGILHHLDLEKAYGEIARVLHPRGAAVFIEPMGHNPLINAYRRRTPHLRTVDEHPLLMSDLRMARRWFGGVETRFFTLTSLAAVPLRDRPAFPAVVRALDRVDAGLFRLLPPTRRHAWMVGMVLTDPRPGEAA